MRHTRVWSGAAWLVVALMGVIPLLLPAPFGALASGGHTHSWSASPEYSNPYPYVAGTQVVTSAAVGIYASMGSGMMDMDQCTGTIDPMQNIMCSFSPSYGYQPMAQNALLVVGWSADRAGGKFGWLASGQFVEKGANDPWSQVTHYKAPPTTGPVVLTVTVKDDPHATDPETNTVINTAYDGQKSGSITITVANDPSRPTWYPDTAITGAAVTAPGAGATTPPGQPITCSAATAADVDKKEPPQMYMYGMAQTEYPADSVTYRWTASGGSFANPNA